MKTKLAYVLISGGQDLYTAMVTMSLYTFRHQNRNAEAVVVMDKSTHLALEQCGSSLLTDATPIVVDIPEEYNLMQRSRYLKTNLRQFVEGDFLYIDSDTFIADKLDDIDQVTADIAMVTDNNNPNATRSDPKELENSLKAGFTQLEGEPYYNGGVMFVRDTPATHAFFNTWYECWKKSVGNGISFDQPALCETNRQHNHPVQELPGIWNCQYCQYGMTYYQPYVKKSKVLHYYTVLKHGRLLNYVLNQVKDKGKVTGIVAMLLRHPRMFARMREIALFIHNIQDRFRRS